ncbi:hypothetical protein [Marinobacterium jannaschii]|uniref:hypothetical protein n=1 Tax=Marinobacterium jannaschii TaxID=64970 RepID=UPI000484199F|nr:hypothetical protein [Marinobacterium jannaschii]
MQRALILAIVFIFAAAGLIFYQKQNQPASPTAPETAATEAGPVDLKTRQAAKAHIDQLTDAAAAEIAIEQADHFVTAAQLLKLPKTEASILQLESVQPNTTEENGISITIPLESGSAIELTPLPGDRTESFRTAQGDSIITDHQGQSVLRGVLPRVEQSIKLQELLDNPDHDGRVIFYIHAVQDGDRQGLWGIIQNGLTRTFAKGIRLRQMDQTVSADIPEDADEKLSNDLSSFLGRLLQDKVSRTYVYNYRKGVLGNNPDLIEPGQQLIVVTFSEEELIRIYQHFSEQNVQ